MIPGEPIRGSRVLIFVSLPVPLVYRSLIASAAALLFLALPAAAEGQARSASARDTVPLGMLPPTGKCRIWMDGVPAAQQPAATDCSTALRQRPANGTILYGPASRETSGGRFDPRVGDRATRRTATPSDSVDRAGSKAERELQRRRNEEERQKSAAELRERYDRARQNAIDRERMMRRGGAAAPANARGGNGTTENPDGAKKPPAEPPPPPAGPAKKKPE